MYKKELIGITGHSGILGTEISKKLKKNNYRLYYYKSDILNKKDLTSWILKHKFDIILHLAAKVPTRIADKNFSLVEKVNFSGTKNLVEAIKQTNKKIYLFFSSSSHIYKFSNKEIDEKNKYFGISKYGKTKIKAEKYLLKNKKYINLCIGRISSLTSEQQNSNYFLVNLIKKIKNKKKIFFKNSNIKRNFIHVEDVSKIICKIINVKLEGIYNISSDDQTNFSKLFQYLNKKYDVNIKYKKGKKEYLILSNNLIKKKIKNLKFIKINKIIDRIYKYN